MFITIFLVVRMGNDWDKLSSCVIIGISDDVGNCTFGDVTISSCCSSCVTGWILFDGSGVFIIILGYIDACDGAVICEFCILYSNLCMGVREGETCRLSGMLALKIL